LTPACPPDRFLHLTASPLGAGRWAPAASDLCRLSLSSVTTNLNSDPCHVSPDRRHRAPSHDRPPGPMSGSLGKPQRRTLPVVALHSSAHPRPPPQDAAGPTPTNARKRRTGPGAVPAAPTPSPSPLTLTRGPQFDRETRSRARASVPGGRTHTGRARSHPTLSLPKTSSALVRAVPGNMDLDQLERPTYHRRRVRDDGPSCCFDWRTSV
jgi:hypothetical protein